MRYLAPVLLCLLALPALAQQGWGNLDALLFRHLTTSGTAESSVWLPDSADPAQARVALGVVYEHIPGSAGSVGIATGVFRRQGAGWVFAGEVQGIFGYEPRDPAFGPQSVDLTTSTLGPNDPRCCPTQTTRWRVDLQTLQVLRLN